MQNEKALRSQKRDLKKSNCKSKKDKGGILDLIFKKEPKRYTVEDTIPYLRLLKSGICQLDERHFSKSIAFQDINYQLALDEDRDLIFNQFANFLNSFDPSISIEFSYINQLGRNEEMKYSSLTAIRMAWKLRFAGCPPVRRVAAGIAVLTISANSVVVSIGC